MVFRPTPLVVPVPAKSAVPAIVEWARWGVANHEHFEYAEVRPLPLTERFPIRTDCSFFVKLCYWWAGCVVDPTTGGKFTDYGNTGTLLAHNRHIPYAKAKAGDVAVYGPGGGVHGALVIARTTTGLLMASMGEQGDPSLVTDAVLRSLGEPTYLRANTACRRPVYPPR